MYADYSQLVLHVIKMLLKKTLVTWLLQNYYNIIICRFHKNCKYEPGWLFTIYKKNAYSLTAKLLMFSGPTCNEHRK